MMPRTLSDQVHKPSDFTDSPPLTGTRHKDTQMSAGEEAPEKRDETKNQKNIHSPEIARPVKRQLGVQLQLLVAVVGVR